MKIIQSVLVVTVIGIAVAFPTPQEVKTTTTKAAVNDEHVPTVQKIEIHVEVKAMSPDIKMPATVTVSEVHEPSDSALKKEKAADANSPKSNEPVEADKSADTSKPIESDKLHKTKRIEVVVKSAAIEESKTKSVNGKADVHVEKVAEKLADVKTSSKVVDKVMEVTSKPKETVKDVSESKSALEPKPTAATFEPESMKVEESKTKSVVLTQDTSTSEPRPVVVEAPLTKSNKDESTKSVAGDTKQKANDDDDSKEDNSSEESPKELIRASPVVTLEDAVKETMVKTVKEEEKTFEAHTVETQVPVVTERMKQGAKSVEDETVIPIVEDLPNKKPIVEAEPTYRMIPVTVVIDQSKLKEIVVTTAEPVKPVEQKEEEMLTVKTIEPEPAVKKSVESEALKDNIAVVQPVESETVSDTLKEDDSSSTSPKLDSIKTEGEMPLVKSIDLTTVNAEVQDSTITEVQKDDIVTRAAEPTSTVVDPVTVSVSPVNTDEALPKASSEPDVFVVEPVGVVQQDPVETERSVEPAKETEVEEVKSVKAEGSSTKAATTENETSEKQVEDSSISSSTTTKALEDATKLSEVLDKVEEAATEEAEVTTTTTTTPASVKAEGKKGKKKLPANIRGYSKRLQQDQKKSK